MSSRLVIKKFVAGSKRLSTHPTEETVKRTTARVLRDLAEIKASSPEKEKYSVLFRIGSLLKAPAYKASLKAAIISGRIVQGYGSILWSRGIFADKHKHLTIIIGAILGLLGGAVAEKGLKEERRLRRNLRRAKKLKKQQGR